MPPDQAHPAAQDPVSRAIPARYRERSPTVTDVGAGYPEQASPVPRNHQAIRSLTVTPTLTSPWPGRNSLDIRVSARHDVNWLIDSAHLDGPCHGCDEPGTFISTSTMAA